MTAAHVECAMSHDWRKDAWIFGNTIQIVTDDEHKAFTTFKALRLWAGY